MLSKNLSCIWRRRPLTGPARDVIGRPLFVRCDAAAKMVERWAGKIGGAVLKGALAALAPHGKWVAEMLGGQLHCPQPFVLLSPASPRRSPPPPQLLPQHGRPTAARATTRSAPHLNTINFVRIGEMVAINNGGHPAHKPPAVPN
ncbi:uncharacterized protein VTP21DRAFT_5722 [Calcarisporiella thermophila]|uniref:uncharacterized protein n=1 Tax=Calcarisporiella thermophila TaxID=911321 RepID=UPI0037447F73